jgi:KDO2-lipid IV(A) lauroyltransferase
MTQIRYLLEAALLYLLFFFFKLMPAKTASNIGGWIGRNIGARLAASRKALRNIERTLPELDEEARAAITLEMWDNLGRLMAEYSHLEKIGREHTVIEGKKRIADYIDGKKRAVFITAHMANFEVGSVSLFTQLGLKLDATYRAPNNPYSDRLLYKVRTLGGRLSAHAKSQAGGRSMMKAIKDGHQLGILIDQKYNEGINVPFFGRDAMTNPVFVQMAQRFDLDIIPIRIVREDGCSFRVIVEQPLQFTKDEPLESVISKAHMVLEEWIREKPGQWLWLHRRWKD